jgi:CRISPR-associated endonuclease/helicase Cas3
MNMFYAKSSPVETIREHTDRLLCGLETLKAGYGWKIAAEDDFWELLRLAVKLHDFGKANGWFQNKIRQQLGEPLLPCALSADAEIPHNYLSVALIPYSQLHLSKEDWQLLVYAVGYHHERAEAPDRKQIREATEHVLPPSTVAALYEHMQWPYTPEKASNALLNMLEKREKEAAAIKQDPDRFRRYVLLKGLLHRLDHAASAHVEVETGIAEHPGAKTRAFLERSFPIRPAQQFAADHRDRHVVMVASTGSGKTEASLLWADGDKAFITLPLRVSLNAMYDRLKKPKQIGLKNLGLLHSGSFDYLLEKDALDAEESYRISRQLSHKVTLSTIDQILKFPFLYRGFEKELATMAYSRLVIDEIQAYDPNIAAMLIKALEWVAIIGGKFMVMTATMPQLYLDELQRRMANLGQPLAYGEFPNDALLRHRIRLRRDSVLDVVGEIVQEGRQRKVLVICNTVDRAIDVYRKLREAAAASSVQIPIRLLHARFMQKHKSALEGMITAFAESGWHEREKEPAPGIWVTTQVVEASVDVDFDRLYTEACTLDSLFQRMGRCYRVRMYEHAEPNIHVLTENASGIGTVYDRQITSNSLRLLESFDGQMLKESDKMALVRRLYSRENLLGLDFLRKFEQALDLFDNKRMFELTSAESQRLLREIASVEVVPPPYWPTAQRLAEQYAATKDKEARRTIRRELERMTMSLNRAVLERRGVATHPMPTRGLEYLHWISDADVEYEFDEETMTGAGLIYRKGPEMF